MRRIALLLVLALACGRRETPADAPATGSVGTDPQDASTVKVDTMVPVEMPVYVERSMIGTKLDKDGNVAEMKLRFAANEPVHITMWLKESPLGLKTSVEWLDSDGRPVAPLESKEMNGAKIATFKFPGKKPGHYTAKGYWGGNDAFEYGFDIERK